MNKIFTVKELMGLFPAGQWALPAFNVFNMEFVQAVIAGAELERSPVILMLGDPVLRTIGLDMLIDICKSAAAAAAVPVAIALDHGKDAGRLARCIERSVSVMYDGSDQPLEHNIEQTRLWAERAHQAGLSIEAELGSLGAEYETATGGMAIALTAVEDCLTFTSAVAVDFLAVAIGNYHGPYQSEPRLDVGRLKAIHAAIGDVPLVLHGGSGIPADTVRQCIANGVKKVNYGYDLKSTYASTMLAVLKRDPMPFQPPEYIKPVRDALTAVVRARIADVGSAGLADRSR
jgi:fructose-bisphosphate aldolase class II